MNDSTSNTYFVNLYKYIYFLYLKTKKRLFLFNRLTNKINIKSIIYTKTNYNNSVSIMRQVLLYDMDIIQN